jgi:hypothetical protein
MSRKLRVAILVAFSLAAIPLASARVTGYPSSMVVLGSSAATGTGSDPAHPYRDAPANSWATGTNPAVQSVYLRILAANAAIRGHNVNLSGHDATVKDLATQARKAVALTPKPGLVLVEIEGDVECDGKNDSRVAEFGTDLGAALNTLTKGLPHAQILLVSAWGSFPSFVKYLDGLSAGERLKHAGKSLCQLVESPSGRVVASHVAYVKKYVDAYNKQLASVCAQSARCHYDGGAAQAMAVTAADISLDQNHLTIQGQAKLAAIEWGALAPFVKRA